jgi:hypothetical protein
VKRILFGIAFVAALAALRLVYERFYPELSPASDGPVYVDRRLWLRVTELEGKNPDRYRLFECREVQR